jgi:dipeptidyl aminopeptidase/acylaminoacyl peptidase
LEGRAIFITHGASDTRLSADYAYDLAQAVRENGGDVDPWIVPDTEHILAILEHPEAYEQRLVAFFEEVLSGS